MSNKTIGKFEILETLGQGGYGIVYRVKDTILNVERALKVLHPVLLADPTFIERFKREAQIMARLDHPHIVPVYDMDQISEHVYISMKYIPAGSLKDVLKRQGRLSFGRALEITKQIASALNYAYNQPEKLIHRDIKPSNILFERDGSVRLSDFGFAKALASADSISLSASGGMIGTPNYMAPEIWRGKGATAATDVYSLACVFYEMITGQMLFPGESPPEIITLHIIDGAKYPEQWPSGTPKGIEEVMRIAIAKEVAERFQIAGEFAVALETLLKGLEREQAKEAVFKEENHGKENEYRPVELIRQKEKVEEKPEIITRGSAEQREPNRNKGGEGEPRIREPKTAGDGVKIGETIIPRSWLIGGIAGALLLIVVCIGVVIWITSTTVKPTPEPVVMVVTSTLLEAENVVEEKATIVESDTAIPPSEAPSNTATTRPSQTAAPAQSGTFVDENGVEMAWIPAGTFKMGEEEGVGYQECQKYYDECKEAWFTDEDPIHEVYLDVYAIDIYEVTNELFAECVAAGVCKNPGGSDYGNAQYDEHPVVYVSWNDAEAYCEWRGARLPTEAEWEKAARGGLVGKLYPWGDENPICTKGAENGAQYNKCNGQTVAVGSFASNGYGLYDMAGNVWEWVADWYNESYYSQALERNPLGPNTGEYRVLRGGSWYSNPYYLRVANRGRGCPDVARYGFGFRCAGSP
jgi:formylglycine-generating enzyme required for sulfatase activity/serine/threonine protein kinase